MFEMHILEMPLLIPPSPTHSSHLAQLRNREKSAKTSRKSAKPTPILQCKTLSPDGGGVTKNEKFSYIIPLKELRVHGDIKRNRIRKRKVKKNFELWKQLNGGQWRVIVDSILIGGWITCSLWIFFSRRNSKYFLKGHNSVNTGR
jgi:hypothetical protein